VCNRKQSKEKEEAVPPEARVKLSTLAEVRAEMAAVYRLARIKKMPASEMLTFIYGLREIRACIESGTLEDIQAQLAALSARVEARHGH
jgi:hypothetical protein